MRRWLTAVALGGVAVLVLTGCGRPGGVDGDLTDDWAAVGEPVGFTPAGGACHERFVDVGYLSTYRPIDCAQRHDAETAHVGTFTGEDAQRPTPPPPGSPAIRAARAECDRKVNEFVGGDWRGGRLTLSLVPPSDQGWSGGSRWYRCDVGEIESLDNQEVVTRTGSLKGALTGSAGLAYGCFAPKLVNDDIDEMRPVPCTTKHNAEFAGIWDAPDIAYDDLKENDARTERGCMGVIAAFAKVPNDSNLKYRTGWITYYPGKSDWEAGNRGIQCFLWVDTDSLTRSMKGAGTKGLPAD